MGGTCSSKKHYVSHLSRVEVNVDLNVTDVDLIDIEKANYNCGGTVAADDEDDADILIIFNNDRLKKTSLKKIKFP